MAQPLHSSSARACLHEPPPLADALASVAFELHPDGMFAVAPDGELLGANRAGRGLLASEDCLRLVDGRLAAVAGSRVLELEAARCAEREPREVELALPAGRRLSLHLVPLGGASEIVLVIARERGGISYKRAMARFGFTRAEWRVADRVARGSSVREIAQQLGVTVDTVRCHLKQVFVKVGVHRQAELVARLLSR